ncbi:MAG: hypothetical protein Q9157_001843 [Trypethelium eluteriae]
MSATIDTTDVHIGHWINWSSGNVRGSTITLTRRDGALLTAFLAIFVSFAGTRIWKLAAFFIHVSLSRRGSSQIGLFHQRQVILRNSRTAESALWNLLRIAGAWRKSKCHAYRHIGPLAIASLISGLAFAAAGVFSAQVSSASNEVLVSGKDCAISLSTGVSNEEQLLTIFYPYSTALQQIATQRSQQCSTKNASTDSCPTFVKPSLPISVVKDASCPFHQSICQSNNSNLIIDTGYLNSHYDLGMNSPPSERFAFRQILQCAPLALGEYTRAVNRTLSYDGRIHESTPNQQWIQYLYGNYNTISHANFTYQYPVNNPTNKSDTFVSTNFEQAYTLSQFHTVWPNSTGWDFIPIPELGPEGVGKEGIDIMLFFLSANRLLFLQPVDDPWYSAHRGPINYTLTAEGTQGNVVPFWFADNPANVLGCTSQVQFCNPNSLPKGCSPLMSFDDLTLLLLRGVGNSSILPYLEEPQAQAFTTFVRITVSYGSTINDITGTLGATALTAPRTMTSLGQGPLASNQWQSDVEYWLTTQLAGYQRAVVEAASGPKFPGIEPNLLVRPQSDMEHTFCTNQKILSTDFTSFSALGLILTLVIGTVFIIVSVLLEPVLSWLQRKRNWRRDNYALMEWWMNDALQLQSIVHEQLGVTWKREIGQVPVPQPGDQRFATLDTTDLGHPRFKAPATSSTLPVELAKGEFRALSIEHVERSSCASSKEKETTVTELNTSDAHIATTGPAVLPEDGGEGIGHSSVGDVMLRDP